MKRLKKKWIKQQIDYMEESAFRESGDTFDSIRAQLAKRVLLRLIDNASKRTLAKIVADEAAAIGLKVNEAGDDVIGARAQESEQLVEAH